MAAHQIERMRPARHSDIGTRPPVTTTPHAEAVLDAVAPFPLLGRGQAATQRSGPNPSRYLCSLVSFSYGTGVWPVDHGQKYNRCTSQPASRAELAKDGIDRSRRGELRTHSPRSRGRPAEQRGDGLGKGNKGRRAACPTPSAKRIEIDHRPIIAPFSALSIFSPSCIESRRTVMRRTSAERPGSSHGPKLIPGLGAPRWGQHLRSITPREQCVDIVLLLFAPPKRVNRSAIVCRAIACGSRGQHP
jgi:hypothetical protein